MKNTISKIKDAIALSRNIEADNLNRISRIKKSEEYNRRTRKNKLQK